MKFPGFHRGVLCLALVQLLSVFAISSAFATSPAYHINGRVLDQTNNPVVGVGVSATATIGTNQITTATVNTDGNGSYSLSVQPGTWAVSVDCSDLSSMTNSQGNYYNCVDSENVTISNQNGTAVFVVPNPGNEQLDGYVLDTNNNPIAGVGIVATSTSDTNLPNQYAITDANGYFTLSVLDVTWDVSVSCSNLTELGFQCVPDQTLDVVGAYYTTTATNFVAQTNGATVVRNFFTVQDWLGGGWYYLGAAPGQYGFGYFNTTDYPFIYHNDMGWLYFFPANDSSQGAYFYDFTSQAFFYTTPALWPYLYDFNKNTWMFYAPRTGSTDGFSSNPRWFLNLTTKQWGNSL